MFFIIILLLFSWQNVFSAEAVFIKKVAMQKKLSLNSQPFEPLLADSRLLKKSPPKIRRYTEMVQAKSLTNFF